MRLSTLSPSLLLTLLRARMTTISGVTHLTAHLLPHLPPLHPSIFLASYLFILLTQFSTHALGDYHDRLSDSLNTTATPITGGSRALLRRRGRPAPLSPTVALITGHILAALAALTLFLLVPSAARPLGVLILILAYSYSAPPLLLNHRGLGEVSAAVVTNILVPLFSATVAVNAPPQHARGDAGSVALPVVVAPTMLLLVLPPFFVKIAAFVVLNVADRRPDWAAGKRTLAVVLGDARAVRLVALLHALAYATVPAIHLLFAIPWSSLSAPLPPPPPAALSLAVLATAPYGLLGVVRPLRKLPYRKDAVLAPTLMHSMMLVWPIAAYALGRRLVEAQHPLQALLSVETVFFAFFARSAAANVLGGRRRAAAAAAAEAAVAKKDGREGKESGRADAAVNLARRRVSVDELRRHSDAVADADAMRKGESVDCRDSLLASSGTEETCVTVVGAGVAGLAVAASLRRLGLSVVVLERRDSAKAARVGADMALWPGAIAIMKELGVPETFFEEHCYPLDTVRMCNMDFVKGCASVLKTIDMKAVTEGSGGRFVLVPREPLMVAMQRLVPDDGSVIRYGANVVKVEESEETQSATVWYDRRCTGETGRSIASRVVVAADGARSSLRGQIVNQAGGNADVRFCGEICYRGIVDFKDVVAQGGDAEQLRSLFFDQASDHTMRINYGAGLRSSFGMLSDGVAYWWVKQVIESMPEHRGKLAHCPWPEPLRTLHDASSEDAFYLHPIEDSDVLPKWSSTRIVLVGDAAHAVMPTMGQGACMSIEDGFVLAMRLRQYWDEQDGHLEAFYEYEGERKPFATAVRAEARTQRVLSHLKHPVAVSVREALLRNVPDHVLQKKLRRNIFPVEQYIGFYRKAGDSVGKCK